MYYFIGWPFVTDEQAVTCAGATNPAYLTSWFTSRKLVTASGTSATIIVDLTGTNEVDYVVLYNVTVPAASLSPTWRAQVYDAVGGGGSELLDSGTLSAVSSFPSLYLPSASSTEPPQLIHTWTAKESGGRAVPAGTSLAKSIKITLTTSSAAVWQIGYIAAGDMAALSSSADAKAGYDPESAFAGRSVQVTGGAVTDSRLTSVETYPLNLAVMSEADMEQLRALFNRVADSRPFFLYPSVAPTSRASQLGIVRFAASRLAWRQRGTRLSSPSLWSLSTEVSPWR